MNTQLWHKGLLVGSIIVLPFYNKGLPQAQTPETLAF